MLPQSAFVNEANSTCSACPKGMFLGWRRNVRASEKMQNIILLQRVVSTPRERRPLLGKPCPGQQKGGLRCNVKFGIADVDL